MKTIRTQIIHKPNKYWPTLKNLVNQVSFFYKLRRDRVNVVEVTWYFDKPDEYIAPITEDQADWRKTFGGRAGNPIGWKTIFKTGKILLGLKQIFGLNTETNFEKIAVWRFFNSSFQVGFYIRTYLDTGKSSHKTFKGYTSNGEILEVGWVECEWSDALGKYVGTSIIDIRGMTMPAFAWMGGTSPVEKSITYECRIRAINLF